MKKAPEWAYLFPNFKPQGVIEAAMHYAKHNIKVNELRETLQGNYFLGKD